MKQLTKWEMKRVKKYFEISLQLQKDPRMNAKEIAKNMKHTGRGRSSSTIKQHYLNMLTCGNTRKPILILKAFEESKIYAHFCVKRSRKNINATYDELKNLEYLDYVLFLAGEFDFFITSRKDLSFNTIDIKILEKSVLFNTVFVHPQKVRLSTKDAIDDFTNHTFTKKKKLDRKIGTGLQWNESHWAIYNLMKGNVRKPFTQVGRAVGLDHKTVKKHFYENILPKCEINHYFWPFGYDYYLKTFMRIKTDYESDLLDALKKLPCTTYVYVLKDEVAITVFHDDTNYLVTSFVKLEERGIVRKFSYYSPVRSHEIKI